MVRGANAKGQPAESRTFVQTKQPLARVATLCGEAELLAGEIGCDLSAHRLKLAVTRCEVHRTRRLDHKPCHRADKAIQ